MPTHTKAARHAVRPIPRGLVSGALAVAALLVPPAAPAAELAVGRSIRPGNLDLAFGVGPAQLEYVDEGRQPDGIANRNRVVDLDLVGQLPLAGVPLVAGISLFAKIGLSCSALGRSASGHGNGSGLSGRNVGAGLDLDLLPGWALRAQFLVMRYRQVDVADDETFQYGSLLLVRRF